MTSANSKNTSAAENEKIKIGWFSFSCCEDNTVVFTELLNDHWKEWKALFDFKHIRVLKSHNVLDDLDIAFIEGAIASDDQAEKLKEIRGKTKKIVAVGACAVMGMPSAQRNYFNERQKQEIEFLVARFRALPKVLKVADVITVDAEVPGCPMEPNNFLTVTNKIIAELRHE